MQQSDYRRPRLFLEQLERRTLLTVSPGFGELFASEVTLLSNSDEAASHKHSRGVRSNANGDAGRAGQGGNSKKGDQSQKGEKQQQDADKQKKNRENRAQRASQISERVSERKSELQQRISRRQTNASRVEQALAGAPIASQQTSLLSSLASDRSINHASANDASANDASASNSQRLATLAAVRQRAASTLLPQLRGESVTLESTAGSNETAQTARSSQTTSASTRPPLPQVEEAPRATEGTNVALQPQSATTQANAPNQFRVAPATTPRASDENSSPRAQGDPVAGDPVAGDIASSIAAVAASDHSVAVVGTTATVTTVSPVDFASSLVTQSSESQLLVDSAQPSSNLFDDDEPTGDVIAELFILELFEARDTEEDSDEESEDDGTPTREENANKSEPKSTEEADTQLADSSSEETDVEDSDSELVDVVLSVWEANLRGEQFITMSRESPTLSGASEAMIASGTARTLTREALALVSLHNDIPGEELQTFEFMHEGEPLVESRSQGGDASETVSEISEFTEESNESNGEAQSSLRQFALWLLPALAGLVLQLRWEISRSEAEELSSNCGASTTDKDDSPDSPDGDRLQEPADSE